MRIGEWWGLRGRGITEQENWRVVGSEGKGDVRGQMSSGTIAAGYKLDGSCNQTAKTFSKYLRVTHEHGESCLLDLTGLIEPHSIHSF